MSVCHDEEIPEDVDPQRPSPPLLQWAYRHGMFPMWMAETDRIEWFDPPRRGILPLDGGFHAPRSLLRVARSGRFRITADADFEAVMRACAGPRPDGEGTWIDDRLLQAYVGLHETGHAHSIEAWRGGALVGGLYGVHLGAAFFGESMFVRPRSGGRDASKVCLVHLVEHLRARGFTLLDTQFVNEHLEQFGVREISRAEYHRRLRAALQREAEWGTLAV